MSEAAKRRPSNRVGKNHSAETRARISRATRERTKRGSNHYAWTNGKHQRDSDGRRTPEYQAWRAAVFARDGFACQQCGDARGGNLHAHHIKTYAEYPEMRLDVTNGVTLCGDCHERIHLKPIPPRRARRKKHTLPVQQQEFIWA